MNLKQFAAHIAAEFEKHYGRAPRWIVAAPGRVNVIGEHTDYNDGFVLPMAIVRYAFMAADAAIATGIISAYDTHFKENATIDVSAPVTKGEPKWSNYIRGVLAGFQGLGVEIPAMDVAFKSIVPLGGGLSSSAALEVCTATLIEAATGKKIDPVGNALINARSETLESRTAFREAFKRRRCLIPADSFYEWKEMHGERQPFRVMLKSGEPFCFAGLWDRWVKPPAAGKFDTDLDEAPASETIDSFTIITRAANAATAPLHDRMPVIMSPNHFGWWLKDDDGRSESHKMALGHPLEEPLKIYPVSDLVNSPKTDDARCIEPVRIDRDFFERQWWGDS